MRFFVSPLFFCSSLPCDAYCILPVCLGMSYASFFYIYIFYSDFTYQKKISSIVVSARILGEDGLSRP